MKPSYDVPRRDLVKGFDFTVPRNNGSFITVTAYETATPGLIVHNSVDPAGGLWTITHRQSGCKVASVDTYRQARAVAGALGGLPLRWAEDEDTLFEDCRAHCNIIENHNTWKLLQVLIRRDDE